MRLKFGALKLFVFSRRLSLKGQNEICHKCWSFCMNGSEWNEAKKHFETVFRFNHTHHPFGVNFDWKCTKTLVVEDNILYKVVRVYSIVQ